MPTPPITGVTVCVDYNDYLKLTLPYNRHHFSKCVVVTVASDRQTKAVASNNNCDVFVTDRIYKDGSEFSKWAAVSHAVSRLKGSQWVTYFDADTLLPKRVPWHSLRVGNLYTPIRRQIPAVCDNMPQERYWPQFEIDGEATDRKSCCLVWHTDDKHVTPADSWSSKSLPLPHAGCTPEPFQKSWPEDSVLRTPFDVLHLSKPRMDWCGRVSRYLNGEVNIVAEHRYEMLKKYIDYPKELDLI